MSKYILENEAEFERLENQSKDGSYDYRGELAGFNPKPIGSILDAGCGSGIVSRYLAHLYPHAQITGCDFSEVRIKQAKAFDQSTANLHFLTQDLTRLDFDSANFDAIVCRFVLEHLNQKNIPLAVAELFRCLRPNGIIRLIDIDGFLFNLFPQSEFIQKSLQKIATEMPFDLFIGRKLPHHLQNAGFSNIQWKIETLEFSGEKLKAEIELNRARFDGTISFFEQFLGGQGSGRKFAEEYLECLQKPNAVLFYNKFIVSAEKPGLKRQGIFR